MKKIIAIALLISGCSTATPDPKSPLTSPNSIFKKELSVKINGVAYDGVGVIPKSDKYSIVLTSRVDVDRFSVTTCHRDFEIDDAINVTWIRPKRSYQFDLVPVKGVEDVGSCLMRIGAFNKGKNATSFGEFDFETDFEKLPAQVTCNGSQKQTNGVSACQGRYGLVQSITFPVPVKIDNKDDACVPYDLRTKDNKTFEYDMPIGECVMTAREIADPHRFHRHTNFGYNDYILGE